MRVETDMPDGKCPDCGAHNGRFHHFGCHQEVCPICGKQIISCGCDIEIVKIEKYNDERKGRFLPGIKYEKQ